MMRPHLPILALAAFALSSPAAADVTARYSGTGKNAESLIVTIDSSGLTRAEAGPPNQPRARMILIHRDGTDFASGADAQGRFTARVEDMIALAVETVRNAMPAEARQAMRDMVNIRIEIAEGGMETVAGRQGRVYRITPIVPPAAQPAAAQESEEPHATATITPVEVVISDDPQLAPVGREMARLFDHGNPLIEAVLGSAPPVIAQIRELLGRGTLLRLGDQARLRSVSTEDVADTAFALPGPVLTRAELRTRMPQPPSPQPPTQE